MIQTAHFAHRRFTHHVFALTAALLAATACSSKSEVESLVDESIRELEAVAELDCKCWRENEIASQQECLDDWAVSPSAKSCAIKALEMDEAKANAFLECDIKQSKDLAACLKPLMCSETEELTDCYLEVGETICSDELSDAQAEALEECE